MGKLNSYYRPSVLVLSLVALMAIFSWHTPNSLLTTASVMALPIYASLLWVRGEPPVLFFIIVHQWLEVTLEVFYANVSKLPIEELAGIPEVGKAVMLGLAALLALALGMRLAMSRLRVFEGVKMREEVTHFSSHRLWTAYLVAFPTSLLLAQVAYKFPSFTQPLLGFSYFKWLIFFLLAFTVLQTRKRRAYLVSAVVLETILGFTGYFSKFTYVFFLLIIVSVTVGYRMNVRNFLRLTAVGTLLLLLTCAWMSVKMEYRSYVNLGGGQQKVLVPFKERAIKMIGLLSSLDRKVLKEGLGLLVGRIAYIDYFAHVLHMVPQVVPHENGRLWEGVLKHIFMPRVFFPSKPVLASDSLITMKYTGLWVAGEEEGTSISIGYVAESYIDFGSRGMFIPIFILGLLSGFLYRYLTTSTQVKIFGYAAATVTLIDVIHFGSTNTKLVGGLLISFITMALALKFLTPPLHNWLIARQKLVR